MIQLNLLPDIKLQFIKAKKSKRMVMVFAALAIAASVGLLAIMFSLTMLQKSHISDLNKDIKSIENELQDTPDLAKILTIQNQLNSLPAMYSKRPVTSRLFPYLEQMTPANVGISHLILDYSLGTLTIEGSSDTLESVNRYVDTIKFTKFTVTDPEKIDESETGVGTGEDSAPDDVIPVDTPAEEAEPVDEGVSAFSEIVLTQFARDAKEATYGISMKFDPAIFDSSKIIVLSVPQGITTRSETQLPGSTLFIEKAKK